MTLSHPLSRRSAARRFLWPLVLGSLSLFPVFSASRCAAVSFSNTNLISINDSTNPPTLATPYPSSIVVTGLTGTVVTKITVQLSNITHTFPDDIDIVLVGPQGQNTVLMSNVGGETRNSVTNVTLTLDDDALSSLPLDTMLVSGTFQPTRRLPNFTFTYPPPAPPAPVGASLSMFNGTAPNGTWRLFVIDDAYPDSGLISGGWSMAISTIPLLLSINQVGTNAVISWTNAASGYTLQTAPALSSPINWTTAAPPAVVVSGRFTVTNPISGPGRFYRLIK